MARGLEGRGGEGRGREGREGRGGEERDQNSTVTRLLFCYYSHSNLHWELIEWHC